MIPRGSPHNRNAPSMPALPVNRGQGCARAGIIPPAPDEAVAQVAEATACRREFPASRCVVACCPIYPPWSSTHKFSTCFFRAISGGNGRALGTEQATVGWTWARLATLSRARQAPQHQVGWVLHLHVGLGGPILQECREDGDHWGTGLNKSLTGQGRKQMQGAQSCDMSTWKEKGQRRPTLSWRGPSTTLCPYSFSSFTASPCPPPSLSLYQTQKGQQRPLPLIPKEQSFSKQALRDARNWLCQGCSCRPKG